MPELTAARQRPDGSFRAAGVLGRDASCESRTYRSKSRPRAVQSYGPSKPRVVAWSAVPRKTPERLRRPNRHPTPCEHPRIGATRSSSAIEAHRAPTAVGEAGAMAGVVAN